MWMRAETAIILGGAAVAASLFDLRQRRIPNVVTGPATVLLIGAAACQGPSRAVSAIAWGSLVACVPGLLHLVDPKGMGGGDVKLVFVIGLAEGAFGLVALFVGCAAALAVIAAFRPRSWRADGLPLAPFLAAGALAGGLMA